MIYNKKRVKKGWVNLLLLSVVALLALGSSGTRAEAAHIYLSQPVVGGLEKAAFSAEYKHLNPSPNLEADGSENTPSDWVEAGAFFVNTVFFVPDKESTKVTSVKIFLDYDKDKLAQGKNLVFFDHQSGNLTSGKSPYVDPQSGFIMYDRIKASGPGITCNTNEKIPLFSIGFWVSQDDALNGTSFKLKIAEGQESYIGTSINGIVTTYTDADLPPAINIEKTHAPSCLGIDAIPADKIKGGIPDSNNPANTKFIGNTTFIDWSALIAAATDKIENAQTPDKKKKLHFNLYRSEINPFVPGAANRIMSDSLGNTATLYQYKDSNLADGTTYYYILRAQDSCLSPNENNDSNAVEIIPYDLEAPPEIAGFKSTASNKKISLNWQNPQDADLYGVVIFKSSITDIKPALQGAFKDPGTPQPAKDGSLYYPAGDPQIEALLQANPNLQINNSVGKWQVILNTNKGGNLVTAYEDTNVENGKTYHYTAFTYDKATDLFGGSPRQQGLNYSQGAVIQAIPGEAPPPVSNFIATSSTNQGVITLQWDIPADLNYAGTKIYYTDNKNAWNSLTLNEAEGPDKYKPLFHNDFPEAQFFKTLPNQNTPTIDFIVENLTTPGNTYYFKAFSYNDAASDDQKYFSKPVATAALSPKEAKIGTVSTFEIGYEGNNIVLKAFVVDLEPGKTVKIFESANPKEFSGNGIPMAANLQKPDTFTYTRAFQEGENKLFFRVRIDDSGSWSDRTLGAIKYSLKNGPNSFSLPFDPTGLGVLPSSRWTLEGGKTSITANKIKDEASKVLVAPAKVRAIGKWKASKPEGIIYQDQGNPKGDNIDINLEEGYELTLDGLAGNQIIEWVICGQVAGGSN